MAVQIEPEIRAIEEAPRGGWRRRIARFARPFMAIELAGFEIMVISLLFSFESNVPYWQHPAYWIRHLQVFLIGAVVAWGIMIWPRRAEISELWASPTNGPLTSAGTPAGKRGNGWGLPLAVNLALFAVLAAATFALTLHGSNSSGPPWGWLALYCVPLAATVLLVVWLFAPISFWNELLRRHPREVAIALAAGTLMLVASVIAQAG